MTRARAPRFSWADLDEARRAPISRRTPGFPVAAELSARDRAASRCAALEHLRTACGFAASAAMIAPRADLGSSRPTSRRRCTHSQQASLTSAMGCARSAPMPHPDICRWPPAERLCRWPWIGELRGRGRARWAWSCGPTPHAASWTARSRRSALIALRRDTSARGRPTAARAGHAPISASAGEVRGPSRARSLDRSRESGHARSDLAPATTWSAVKPSRSTG